MGGAGTAAILEPLGALAWNPAGMQRLERGWRLGIGVAYFMPSRRLASEVPTPGGGVFSGSTRSLTNAAAIPSLAVSYRPAHSRWGLHFGMLGLGGFGVEYPQNAANPVQAPQPAGFGKIQSDYEMLKIPVGFSYRASRHLSFGVSLIPSSASLRVSPAPFATPNANGTYPSAERFSQAWGFSAQVGMHVQVCERLGFGLSVNTPTWFGRHHWNTVDGVGARRDIGFDLDFPMVVSGGVSWQATPRTLLAADVRWIDYADTKGFSGRGGFDPDGAVRSFGWRSIFSFHVGVQHQVTSRLSVRAGYNFTENPVPARLTFFNMPAPAIVQHHLSLGASYVISRHVTAHVAYFHAFANSITGPMHGPAGPVPGTSVTSTLSEDAVSLGLTWAP